jgi:micrococcal nuclease
MHRTKLLAIITACAIATLTYGTRARAQDTVTVKKVVNGTTIMTSSGEKIALLGVATPRTQAITAEDARSQLESLVEGNTVVLIADSLAGADGKGPKLRFLLVGGSLVNLEMIRLGYGTAPKKPNHAHLAEFQAAEKQARAEQVGAWATERATSVQCSATTQKGSRCSRMTTSLSGRCWQHE